MTASALGVAYFLREAYRSEWPEDLFVPFFLLFLLLFAASGIGNGSTFRTIAIVFDKEQAGRRTLRLTDIARSRPSGGPGSKVSIGVRG